MAIDDKLVTLGDLKTVIDNTHDSTKQDTLTFDTTPTQGSTNPVTSGGVYTGLDGKVDKENGKGLSTNDFTDADKQKLAELSQYVGAGIIFDTASGSVASFTDGGDGLPVKSVSVDVDPVQDLHGYDKPWTGGAGKNLLPMTVDSIKAANGGASSWSGNSKTINGVTFTINADSAGNVTGIKANGTASGSTWLVLGSINDFAAGTYILNGTPPTGTSSTYYLALTDSTIGFTPEYGSGVNIVKGASDTGRIGINIRTNYNANNLVFYPMLRLASVSDATFEPYSNICPITGHTSATITREGADSSQTQTYNITFLTAAGTVYGGVLDITQGTLLVKNAYIDLGTQNWTRLLQGSIYLFTLSSDLNPNATSSGFAICSHYKRTYAEWSDMPNYSYRISGANLRIRDDRYTDAASFKSALNGAQLVYRMANPVTYELTPQEITTLLGINHVWSNTGDVSVEYAADPKLYINKVIASALNA